METKVTNLELSTKLKNAGIQAESKLSWVALKGREFELLPTGEYLVNGEECEAYPAYFLSELLDMIQVDWYLNSGFDQKYQFSIYPKNYDGITYGLLKSESMIEAVAYGILWQREHDR